MKTMQETLDRINKYIKDNGLEYLYDISTEKNNEGDENIRIKFNIFDKWLSCSSKMFETEEYIEETFKQVFKLYKVQLFDFVVKNHPIASKNIELLENYNTMEEGLVANRIVMAINKLIMDPIQD